MRRRILASILSTTAFAVLLFAVPLGWAATRLYHAQEITRLEREATTAADLVPENGIQALDPHLVPPRRRPTTLGFYDTRGVRLLGDGPAFAHLPARAALDRQIGVDGSGPTLAVAVPIADGDQTLGAVRAAVPDRFVRDRVIRTWEAMAGVGLAIIGLATGTAVLQSRRLSRPITAVADAAKRLGDGDFTTELAAPGIPEIDSVADALNATSRRLGSMMERERSFSADASHQLFTPLTALRLHVESALMNRTTDPWRALERSLLDVERLQSTVHDLLALARDTSSTASVVNPLPIVAEVRSDLSRSLAARGRRFVVSADAELPAVSGSAAAIRQILGVLVDNATVHGEGVVTLRVRPAGAGVAIEVTDEGRGVASDTEAIFTRHSREAKGHGIGLALARTLAEAEGARLYLEAAGPHPRFVLMLAPAGNGTR